MLATQTYPTANHPRFENVMNEFLAELLVAGSPPQVRCGIQGMGFRVVGFSRACGSSRKYLGSSIQL